MHAGAGFALIAYALESGLGLPTLPSAREHLRCRMVATEIKRLARIFFAPGRIVDPEFQDRPVGRAPTLYRRLSAIWGLLLRLVGAGCATFLY